jgi:hypothetical protein
MARQQVQYDGRAEALQTVAAPKVSGVTARFDPRASQGFALAEALGAAGPTLEKFEKEWEQKKTQEQALKIDAYKEQFLRDWQGGAVSQAQVRERFPETVPIIAARIAESIGADYGKKSIQSIIDEVNINDELRLDSSKRAAFIQQRKQELIGQVGNGNDFYLNGMSKSIDSELNQFENTWQRETAAYHQDVQLGAFKDEVAKAMLSGGDILAVDAKWKGTSSLNNIERNKAVIDAATALAFTADDPSILDRIPERFLNNATKLEIAKSKAQVQAARMTKVRDAQTLLNIQRDEQLRNSKIGMISNVAAGQRIDPLQFKDNPEAFDFALRIQNVGALPTFQSVANAQAVRTEIMNGATVYSGLDQRTMTDAVINNPNINPAEKEALIKEIPTLVEGRIAMDDPMVKNVLDLRINARLKALESSPSAMIASITQGRNLRAEVMRTFDAGIRQEFQSFYEDKKRWPTGVEKQAIIDRQTDKAEKLLEDLTRPGALRQQPGSPASQATPAQTQLPRVTNDADFNALPKGAEFIDPNGVKRRKP